MDMHWEDPPEPNARNRQWVDTFIAECRAHPGKWARMVNPFTGQDWIGSATITKAKKSGLEIRATTLDETGKEVGRIKGGRRVWARWPE